MTTNPDGHNICNAVRAAEQPHWSVSPPSNPTTAIWHDNLVVGHADTYTLAYRIALLLNEDDARGGEK